MSKRITVGVFQGSGPWGPIVSAIVNRRTPETNRNRPSQSNLRRANLFCVWSWTNGYVSLSVRGWTSALSYRSSGSEISGTYAQASIETIAYSTDKQTKGALQLTRCARPPEHRPPMMVAAGVPIRNEEKTMFFRRDGLGYVRLRIPTAKGILAAEAIPAKLDTKSKTTPLLENDVKATNKENAIKLATSSVLRGRVGHVSAI